jgi:hypothetical protein
VVWDSRRSSGRKPALGPSTRSLARQSLLSKSGSQSKDAGNFPKLYYIFDYPRDVVAHPWLSISGKRAILASWTSDASAIASCPALRAPAGLKAPVTIDDIPGHAKPPVFDIKGAGCLVEDYLRQKG